MRILRLAPARRIFLILWGSWTVVALLAACLYIFFHEVGLVLAGILVTTGLITITGIEFNFRRRALPQEARRPWHAILVLCLMSVPILMFTAGNNYAHYLPGSQPHHEDCHLRIIRMNKSQKNVSLIFEFTWDKSNWGPAIRTKKFSETRIWPQDQREMTWILDAGLKEARLRNEPDKSIPLNAAGYEKLIAALVPPDTPPAQQARIAIILRNTLALRSTPTVSVTAPDHRFSSDSDYLDSRNHCWPLLIAGTFSACLLPVSLLVVGVTMFPRSLHP